MASDGGSSFGWEDTDYEEDDITNAIDEMDNLKSGPVLETPESVPSKKSFKKEKSPTMPETNKELNSLSNIRIERVESISIKTEPVDKEVNNKKRKEISTANVTEHTSFSDQLNTTIESSDKLNDFLKDNPKLTLAISSESIAITNDDDVYSLQCPINFDCHTIIELPNLHNKNRSRIPGTNYELNLDKSEEEHINLLIPPTTSRGCVLSSIPLKGHFVVREKVKTLSINDNHIGEECLKVPFPKNLKVRHPLFGNDYKKQIKLSDTIKEKLKEPPKKKKSKKDKDSNSDVITSEHKKDKANKRKRRDSTEEADVLPVKKIKKEKQGWETEGAIENKLFDTKKKNKKNR